jgi:hypothetical protein
MTGDSATDEDKPWDDGGRLRDLYWRQGLSAYEIADRFGCSSGAIYNAMDRHEIDRRTGGEPQRNYYRGRPVRFRTTEKEEERWECKIDGEHHVVSVHRLAAVSWFGFEAVVGNHVHHKIPIRWLNTEWNLEPIDPFEHRSMHSREREFERDEGGRFA